ncbi:probable histone-lysine N-methyltransferase set-23 [Drosophila tropicalis]|uniref:probable histone-lysine N-methyltransferase set-23 n=1 Tax=Drosophila tropicalis TaxID=46794 RepID=UPI0035AB7FC8
MFECFSKTRDLEDNYDHDDDENDLEYILECVLMDDDGSDEYKELRNNYNSQLTQNCNCSEGVCSNLEECLHGGAYECTSNKSELVLKSNNSLPIFECNGSCKCGISCCANRLVQYGPRRDLEIFDSPLYHSKGVRTTVNIPQGAFICEYAGELITKTESQRRIEVNDSLGQMNYVLCLKEFTTEGISVVTFVDPCRRGNIGRYLNHSCQPNCQIMAVRVECPIPKIGIFALRDIDAFEELCFHYGGEEPKQAAGSGKTCLCGSLNCSGFMPNTKM